MTAQRRLDRRARRAILALVFIFLVVIILMLRSCVVAFTSEQTFAGSDSGKDEIVILGKNTMVLPSGSVGTKIVSWLNSAGAGTRAFEVGDRSFPTGSDQPTELGLAHFDRFAVMVKAQPDMKARVIVPAQAPGQSNESLAQRRAARIRTELVKRGVPISQISTEARAFSANTTHSNAEQVTIVVVISK